MGIPITSSLEIPEHEIVFQFTRSGGPGGQNVNKVSTRVELVFNVMNSSKLTDDEKGRIVRKLRSRIDSEGNLRVAAQESRSQWRNREIVVEKLADLLRAALAEKKKRKATRPTKSSKRARVEQKKSHAKKKKLRGKVNRSTE